MSHTALARKHRPRRFAEVATQEHVSETLRRAVASGRVGHAYLFSGPRGVGKTTLARVLAMALNCSARSPEGEPCGVCDDCERIWSGTTSLDVVEIDAASNRGVDDARELRQRAQYAPSEENRFKVYIVDEAHMLTREAWNALLKVLEEPPPRVIFIFATTEPQKIEQTAAPIMSRCQRFDFRRLGVDEIVQRLREVLGAEHASATDEALRIIARKADGGMRDALSLTDQLLALSDDGIRAETVRRILGVVEEERYLQLFDLLAGRDRGGLFVLVEELLDQGYDLVEFYHGLLDSMRTLLRLSVGSGGADLPPEREEAWSARAGRFEPSELVRMLGMAAELETSGSLRRTNQPRILLELLLLRYSYLDRTVEIEDLLRTFGGGGVPGDEDAAGARAPGPPPTPPSTPSPQRDPGARGTGSASSPSAGTPGSPPATRPRTGDSGEDRPNGGSGPVPDPSPDVDESAPTTEGDEGASTSPLEAWNALLASSSILPPGLTPFLLAARVRAGADGLVITIPPGPAEERLREPELRERIREELARRTGRTLGFEVEMGERIGPEDPAIRVSRTEVRKGAMEDLLGQEPGLKPAVEELDLEILD